MPPLELQAGVVRPRGRFGRLRAVIRILAALLRVFDVDLGKRRLPDGDGKSTILRAIDRTREALSLRSLSASSICPHLAITPGSVPRKPANSTTLRHAHGPHHSS